MVMMNNGATNIPAINNINMMMNDDINLITDGVLNIPANMNNNNFNLMGNISAVSITVTAGNQVTFANGVIPQNIPITLQPGASIAANGHIIINNGLHNIMINKPNHSVSGCKPIDHYSYEDNDHDNSDWSPLLGVDIAPIEAY